MATLTVRQLDETVYERLRAQARANNRSLEAEVRQILGERTRDLRPFAARAAELRAHIKAKYGELPDSTELIRQMREED